LLGSLNLASPAAKAVQHAIASPVKALIDVRFFRFLFTVQWLSLRALIWRKCRHYSHAKLTTSQGDKEHRHVMTVRHLEAMFQPTSVALIGASDRAGSLGSVVLHNLKLSGFKGPVWPVNAKHAQVDGEPAWPDVDSLPFAPDLAVICTPGHDSQRHHH
jgi:hypothetical protein